MPSYHVHQWQVRREWKDEDGRLLRHRTCEGCSLEQQVRYVIREMIWTLFRQWDPQNSGRSSASLRGARHFVKFRHTAALVLFVVCLPLSGCSPWAGVKQGMAAGDPCAGVEPGESRVTQCEALRATSTKNALLEDYRKCVDANVNDPTKCSAILQGLNAYSVNVGSNQPKPGNAH